jgi:hypothetical protein
MCTWLLELHWWWFVFIWWFAHRRILLWLACWCPCLVSSHHSSRFITLSGLDHIRTFKLRISFNLMAYLSRIKMNFYYRNTMRTRTFPRKREWYQFQEKNEKGHHSRPDCPPLSWSTSVHQWRDLVICVSTVFDCRYHYWLSVSVLLTSGVAGWFYPFFILLPRTA